MIPACENPGVTRPGIEPEQAESARPRQTDAQQFSRWLPYSPAPCTPKPARKAGPLDPTDTLKGTGPRSDNSRIDRLLYLEHCRCFHELFLHSGARRDAVVAQRLQDSPPPAEIGSQRGHPADQQHDLHVRKSGSDPAGNRTRVRQGALPLVGRDWRSCSYWVVEIKTHLAGVNLRSHSQANEPALRKLPPRPDIPISIYSWSTAPMTKDAVPSVTLDYIVCVVKYFRPCLLAGLSQGFIAITLVPWFDRSDAHTHTGLLLWTAAAKDKNQKRTADGFVIVLSLSARREECARLPARERISLCVSACKLFIAASSSFLPVFLLVFVQTRAVVKPFRGREDSCLTLSCTKIFRDPRSNDPSSEPGSSLVLVPIRTIRKCIHHPHQGHRIRTVFFSSTQCAAAAAQRLELSLLTKANRVRFPAGSLPDFRAWGSLAGWFSRGFPIPPFAFRRCSIPRFTAQKPLQSTQLHALEP
ncbi:hypothetical protein PR048_014733 [Dryococelus australis]|uniref:Uncharacterized protein n=1 Tax=Dryococelus australis TaxID=614101 RepID=A0ABQ9HF03_9NEOP|nr:hypothetical protein PR048_014733 [Dryococelus australis]